VIDHHLLGLHHVRDMPVHVPLYDWLFLGLGGVGLIAIGWLLARAPGRESYASASVPPVSRTPRHARGQDPAQSPTPPR
jgi:hypothetical protein